MDRHLAEISGRLHLVSRSVGLPACTLLKLQHLASAWCVDVAGMFQLAKYCGLKDLLKVPSCGSKNVNEEEGCTGG